VLVTDCGTRGQCDVAQGRSVALQAPSTACTHAQSIPVLHRPDHALHCRVCCGHARGGWTARGLAPAWAAARMGQLRHGPLLVLLVALSGEDRAGMTECRAPMLTRRREHCAPQASSLPQYCTRINAWMWLPAAGALAFQDDLLLDVERLLLEQPDASTCSIDGFGAYGTPQYVSSHAAGLVGGYGYGSSSSSLASLDAAGSPGGYGAGYGASTSLGYGYTEDAAFNEAATLTCAPLVTKGRLLGIGGLKNCEVRVCACACVRVCMCAASWQAGAGSLNTSQCTQASCMLGSPQLPCMHQAGFARMRARAHHLCCMHAVLPLLLSLPHHASIF